MSIARAFTTRRVRQTLDFKDGKDNKDAAAAPGSLDGFLGRSKTTKALATHGSIRNKISAPVELTHTTNMLAFNAPDIFPAASAATAAPVLSSSPLSSSPSSASGKSDDESDSGDTAVTTPPSSPDTSFADDKRAMSPEPNHLSCYFTVPKQSTMPDVSGLGIAGAGAADAGADTVGSLTSSSTAPSAPAIPHRSPSHTKKSYDGLGRNRSVSRISEHSMQSMRSLSTKASFSFSRSSSSSTNTSVTSTASHASVTATKPSFQQQQQQQHAPHTTRTVHRKEYSETHPFGHELAKVSELVEEFTKEDEVDAVLAEPAAAARPSSPQKLTNAPPSFNPVYAEEERELARQGLKKYSAESYVSDIQSLMASFFSDARPMATTVWI